MGSLKIKIPPSEKIQNKETHQISRRPPPIKIEQKTSWSETKSLYDPPPPPKIK